MKTLLKRLRCRARSCRAERRMERKTRRLFNEWVEEKGYLKNQGMDDAAESMGISAFQLKYFFSSTGRKPFLVWRKEMRVEEALRIMKKDPDRKLDAVAIDVGIMNARNLRRQIEETKGISLSEWRKDLQRRKKKSIFARFLKECV